jgi:two-component system, cell cycle sensor histidine kinase and response regulator CckA
LSRWMKMCNPMKKKSQQAPQVDEQQSQAPGSQTHDQLLHDLEVHQAELEQQNEELHQAQQELVALNTRYIDLFELAPVGYLVLSEKGLILEANLTAAGLLGVARSALILKPLTRFILPEDQDIFYQHRKLLFESGAAQEWQLRIMQTETEPTWVRLQGSFTQDEDGTPVCRVAMSDISERKQAEERLRESEMYFQTLFDQAAVGVALVNTVNGRYVRINQKYCDFLGYTKDELLGKTFMDVTHPDDVQENVDKNALLMAEKSMEFSVDKCYFRKDGSVVWGNLTASPLWKAGETPALHLHIAVVQDISERKQAEQARQVSEEALVEAQQIAQIGSWVYDIATDKVTWSRQMFDLFGRDPDDGEPPSWQEHQKSFHPDDWETLDKAVEASATAGTPYNIEFRLLHPTRGVRWAWTIGEAVSDQTGTITTLKGTVQDITERKQAEEQLHRSEAALNKAQAVSHVGSWKWNIKTNQLAWSDEMYHIFGISKENFSGVLEDVIAQAIHPDDRQKVEQSNLSTAQEGKPIPVEYRIVWPDNSVRTVWAEAGELTLDEEGKPTLLSGIVQDISERKHAEEMALASQKLASIGSLAAGMAHEINSPLQLVTGLSERLTRDLNADRIDKQQFLTNVENINKSGWRIANIIRSLLTYARKEGHEMAPQQLNEIIENSLLLIEHQLVSWSNVSIEKELAPHLSLIHCDSNSLTQVILNLLENARDAMPGGGWIKISTASSPKKEQVILRISDTGEGIPAEIQSRIFDPFFTTKDVGKGTGLGLSIVQGIIQAHSGDIQVSSPPGKGTTFTICLPEKPAPTREKELSGRY